MSAATDDFWTRKKQLDEQTKRVETMVQAIIKGANDLKIWRQATVSGTGGFPAHLLGSTQVINANEWPSGQQLGQALSTWHSLDHEYRNSWRRLTPDEQDQMRAHEPQTGDIAF
jgi:hypothetical protein